MIGAVAPILLFDMDGTLVDSTAVVEQTWTAFASRHGLDAEVVIDFAHGRPTASTVRHFLAAPALIETEIAGIVAYESTVVDGIVEIPGAAAMIRGLATGSWAVVTSAGRDLARHRLSIAEVMIPDVVVSSDDVTRGKPDPQGYLLAADALGVDIADCIVFEDSEAGVHAGVASGATTIVVGSLRSFDGSLRRIADFSDFDLDAILAVAT